MAHDYRPQAGYFPRAAWARIHDLKAPLECGYDAHMALMGDGYRGTYQGHTIELIRDNLAKKLRLVIDGVEVATARSSAGRHLVVHQVSRHRRLDRSASALRCDHLGHVRDPRLG